MASVEAMTLSSSTTKTLGASSTGRPYNFLAGAYIFEIGQFRPHQTIHFLEEKVKTHYPSFVRKKSFNGRWDAICMSCFTILVADQQSELPALEAAHACTGFSLESILHPENPTQK
jgi:hypothetical protein